MYKNVCSGYVLKKNVYKNIGLQSYKGYNTENQYFTLVTMWLQKVT